MTTFVTVGNARQPFTRLLVALEPLVAQLPQPVIVQCGYTEFSHHACYIRRFVGMDEFTRLIDESTLLVMHAGAGSVVSALDAGKTPVVAPRLSRYGEHIDDHQLEFAREMAKHRRVALVEDLSDLRAILSGGTAETLERSKPEPRLISLVRDAISVRMAK